MKRYIKLRHFTLGCFLIALSLLGLSCEEDKITYDESGAIALVVPDSYIQIKTPVVAFQAGTEKYGIKFNAINGTKEISKVMVYSTFTDAASGEVSNEVLLGTYEVDDPILDVLIDSLTYEDLKAGLVVDGTPLPDSDEDLSVGSGWKLRFEGELASGEIVPLAGTISVGVLSKYAGIYRVVKSEYYRIGELSTLSPWNNQQRFIGSVNDSIFSYNDWWGPFAWPNQSFQFKVDFDDFSIFVPSGGGLFSGDYSINCEEHLGEFTSSTEFNCGNSNILIPNDVTGEHTIRIAYGYYLASGDENEGSREYYEELVKIVD